MKTFIVMIFICVVAFPSFSQSKFAVGVQGGRSSLIPETESVPNQLGDFNARGAGGVNMLLYGRYYFQPSWSVRLGGGIIGYRSAHTHVDGTVFLSGFSGVQPQVMIGLDYHLPLGYKDFGIILSAGLNANRAHQYDDRSINSEEGYSLTHYRALNENGEFMNVGILGHDVEYRYSRQKTLLHLRPEIAVFKRLGSHKLLASFVYGHALKEPIFIADYRSISYGGEYYSAGHRFSGSFTALQVGYELSF